MMGFSLKSLQAPLSKAAQIELDFEYQIVRSNRKTMAIHVSVQGVQLRIPHQMTDQFALKFLIKKQQWVKKQLLKHASKSSLIPKLEIGQEILWLGTGHKIQYIKDTKMGISLQQKQFIVTAPKLPTKHQLIKLFQDFFKLQAKQLLVPLTEETCGNMGLLSRLSAVRFRRTKSKWGHCTRQGNIQYNWLIMGAPLEVIEYLVVHEVAHLQYPHHQADFWKLVERTCADYKNHDKWLNQNSIQLTWM